MNWCEHGMLRHVNNLYVSYEYQKISRTHSPIPRHEFYYRSGSSWIFLWISIIVYCDFWVSVFLECIISWKRKRFGDSLSDSLEYALRYWYWCLYGWCSAFSWFTWAKRLDCTTWFYYCSFFFFKVANDPLHSSRYQMAHLHESGCRSGKYCDVCCAWVIFYYSS